MREVGDCYIGVLGRVKTRTRYTSIKRLHCMPSDCACLFCPTCGYGWLHDFVRAALVAKKKEAEKGHLHKPSERGSVERLRAMGPGQYAHFSRSLRLGPWP